MQIVSAAVWPDALAMSGKMAPKLHTATSNPSTLLLKCVFYTFNYAYVYKDFNDIHNISFSSI